MYIITMRKHAITSLLQVNNIIPKIKSGDVIGKETNNSLKGSICDVLPTGKYFFLYDQRFTKL
jgi:hypothetical protein